MHFHRHKLVKSLGELAREIGIIFVGVSIALTAENLMDGVHWREKISNAEAAMRLELQEDDGPQAFVRLAIAPCLDETLGRIHSGEASDEELRRLAASYAPPFRTWDSEAWKVIVASDVGSHMDSSRLIAWSAPYRLFPVMTQLNQLESERVTDLQEALPPGGSPTAEERQALRSAAADLRRINVKLASRAKNILGEMAGIGVRVPNQEELLRQARSRYGNCVRAPEVNSGEKLSEFTSEGEMRMDVLGR